MDEFDIEDMLEDFRAQLHTEVGAAICVIAACVTNAINAQPSVDNLKFTRDLIDHLDGSAKSNEGLSSLAAVAFRDRLQQALDRAFEKAGLPNPSSSA